MKIPTIMRADELLDKAFRKAAKVNVTGRSKIDLIRRKNIAKITSISESISSVLNKYVKAFPSVDNLPPFYREMIDLLVGADELKKSLGSAQWCASQVSRISRSYRSRISRSKKPAEIDTLRAETYGRISSLVKQIDRALIFLGDARNELKRMPTISPDMRTIVVAGAPNVGKSQLVTAISSARPKIAGYPFTTQEISVGILSVNRNRIQIIDTPGLLDRPLEKRNDVERRAILALRYLADMIIFVIDPTMTCGYPLDFQLSLMKSIEQQFPDIRIIAVDNKADMGPSGSDRLAVSALRGDGIDRLIEIVQKYSSDSA